jgi:hypothetical protein
MSRCYPFSGLYEKRFATACKLRDIFTRQQQGEAFRESYKTLPVITTTLRNLGNFKSVFQGTGVVYRLPKITKARAFQLLRQGSHQVVVGMKEFMHHDEFTGMAADGSFVGEPHPFFVGGVPLVEEADPFPLKSVDEDTINKIHQRCQSLHSRVDALYPGECVLRYSVLEYHNNSEP